MAYTGRFAPSPTGALHAGSLVAALASWLDARAHGGRWLVRIEDVDTPRCVPGATDTLLRQLATVGLIPDAPPVYQSQRSALYQAALNQLIAQHHAYGCGCSRKDIAATLATQGQPPQRHGERIYPGTCRSGLQGRTARTWRFLTSQYEHNSLIAPVNIEYLAINSGIRVATSIGWHDRRLGPQQQDVAAVVGDFVLRRADGLWAYQLAVVVDDAAQGITHTVRGEDLADNTARQIMLQRALGLPTPQYLHTPLVLGANGEKLSKQNGAAAVALDNPVQALQQALHALGLRADEAAHTTVAECLAWGIRAWPFTHYCSGPMKYEPFTLSLSKGFDKLNPNGN
jgi:glutamyl-Q tRNA(Asp) synthetase